MTLIYFILILGLTVFIHELGHFIFAKKNGVYCHEFSLGMGPKLYSFRRKNDETEYCLRLLPIGGYVQMAGEEIDEDEDIPKERQMQSKSVWQRFIIVVAGALNNFILGLLLLFLIGIFYGSPETKPYVKSVDKAYNAYKVDIREGDLIKEVNGKRVYTIDDVMLEFQLIEQGASMKFVLEDKNGKEKSVSVKPTKKTSEEGVVSYIYGLSLTDKVNKGFVNAIRYSTSKFGAICRSMFKVVGNLITGNLGLNSLSGPVGIYNVVGEQSKQGFENVVYLAAYISINVGFVNLLPIPAFDGGRALFLIIEKIRRKPMSQRTENIIHSAGFAVLMLLIVVITINDIIRLF